MTKKEKLRVYNDCVHLIGRLQNGNNVMFCQYKDPWNRDYLIVEIKEHDYYIVGNYVDNYIITNFPEVVAIACRHCLKKVK